MTGRILAPKQTDDWRIWAGAMLIMFGATVVFLGAVMLALRYFDHVAPAIVLLSLFVLWTVVTVYFPPPGTIRNE